MTREEFAANWGPSCTLVLLDSFHRDLSSLLSATESAARRKALDEAWNIADAHECIPMGGCRCQGHIMDEIRKAQKQ